jgi:orotidine-5'-phosphate decarboxylase
MIPATGLCVGLDLDTNHLPIPLPATLDGMLAFGRMIVDATRHVATCYKLNSAFYERHGRGGIDVLYALREHIGTHYVILDAKRGDIGTTSSAYADFAFGDFGADAVTVAPYMGRDSVEPFLDVPDKMVYVLALTSNQGSNDFQRLDVNGRPLWRHVIDVVDSWPRRGSLGFVVGATHAAELSAIRSDVGGVPLLIPGIGAQGASAPDVALANGGHPAVFNVSRGIARAALDGNDPAVAIQKAAEELAAQLAGTLSSFNDARF